MTTQCVWQEIIIIFTEDEQHRNRAENRSYPTKKIKNAIKKEYLIKSR